MGKGTVAGGQNREAIASSGVDAYFITFKGELSGAYSGACTEKVPDSDFASIASHSIAVRPGRPAAAQTIPVHVPCFHAVGLPSRWHQGKLTPSLGADSPGHVSVHHPVLAPKRTPVWISARFKRRGHLEVSEVGAGMTMPDRTPRNGSPVPASGISARLESSSGLNRPRLSAWLAWLLQIKCLA